jgi:hypothetical protein
MLTDWDENIVADLCAASDALGVQPKSSGGGKDDTFEQILAVTHGIPKKQEFEIAELDWIITLPDAGGNHHVEAQSV